MLILFSCRGTQTRTADLSDPNTARYQTAPYPEAHYLQSINERAANIKRENRILTASCGWNFAGICRNPAYGVAEKSGIIRRGLMTA